MRQAHFAWSLITLLASEAAKTFTVNHADVHVGGYVCGEYQNSRVFFPEAPAGVKFPLISFAHGYNNEGAKAYNSYSTMLTDISAAGYIVIVFKDAAFPLECSKEWKDQMRSIEWAKTSNFSSIIDFTVKTGILGHSMGGGATYHSAGQADAVKTYNIGAAVALHPEITSPWSFLPVTNSLVPIFFATGSDDSVVKPNSVKAAYNQTKNVPKIFVEIAGATHDEPLNLPWGKGRYTPFVIAMFDCHLKGDTEKCQWLYTDVNGALCGSSVKMTDCEHGNEPVSKATVVVV